MGARADSHPLRTKETIMDIGDPIRRIIVEPERAPEKVPSEPAPEREPVAPEPEKVPA